MDRLIHIILFLFLLFVQTIKAQVYDFTADLTVGCDSLNIQFTLTDTTGATTAQWDFGNGITFNGLNPPVISYDTIGFYNVSVTINGTEQISKSNYIGVYTPPNSSFSFDDTTIIGSYNILFTVVQEQEPFDTVQYYYNWDFGDLVQFTALQRQHGHRYPDEGEYIVSLTVSDNYGCESSSSDTVIITNRFNLGNVFTPNDDGINDEFIIETNGLTVYSFIVFTRTGTMVYKTESPIIIWDGKNNSGVKMSPGIYYYVIKELNGSGNNQTGFFYMFY